MESYNGGYSSLGGQAERPVVYAWWWRLVSFFSSFLILLGFLSLQPLFEDQPKLRLSNVALCIVAVAFFTTGFSLTALLCFACRDARFQLDVIFTPALFSTITGLFAIFYNLAISSRYHWAVASTVGTVVGVVASLIYLSLAIMAQRRYSRRQPNQRLSQPGKRLRELFGIKRKESTVGSANPIITIASDEAPVEIIPGGGASEDEEMTRQHMMSLLKQRENMRGRHSDASLRTTYNIELPPLPKAASDNRLSMPPHVRDYYSPLNPNAAAARRPRAESETTATNTATQSHPSGNSSTLETSAATAEEERSMSRENRRMVIELGEERARSRSREIRRREIEMGRGSA